MSLIASIYVGFWMLGVAIVLITDLARACRPRTILRDVLILPPLWPVAIVLHWLVMFREWGGNLDGHPDV